MEFLGSSDIHGMRLPLEILYRRRCLKNHAFKKWSSGISSIISVRYQLWSGLNPQISGWEGLKRFKMGEVRHIYRAFTAAKVVNLSWELSKEIPLGAPCNIKGLPNLVNPLFLSGDKIVSIWNQKFHLNWLFLADYFLTVIRNQIAWQKIKTPSRIALEIVEKG